MMPVCVNCESGGALSRIGPNTDFALAKSISRGRDCDGALPWYARVPQKKLMAAMWKQCLPPVFAGSSWSAGPCGGSVHFFAGSLEGNMVSGADLPEILNDWRLRGRGRARRLRHKLIFAAAADWTRGRRLSIILACWRYKPMMRPRRQIIFVKPRTRAG